jgi:hypothetical protein
MWKSMALNVINRSIGVTTKLSAIVKIRKYRRFDEGLHFIPMAMEVHDALECDMKHFVKECDYIFHDRKLRNHLSLFFCI